MVTMNGWDSITDAFRGLYPCQNTPKHYGTLISRHLGGSDPLDGVSIYDAGSYYHFVTYGFSELYDKINDNKEYSGFGFELTFKLKKTSCVSEDEFVCMCSTFQALARYSFKEYALFNPGEYIYTGQTFGVDANGQSKITGFGIALDDKLNEIISPNGKVEFLQLIGLTDKELKAIHEYKITVKEVLDKLNTGVTDYFRSDVI